MIISVKTIAIFLFINICIHANGISQETIDTSAHHNPSYYELSIGGPYFFNFNFSGIFKTNNPKFKIKTSLGLLNGIVYASEPDAPAGILGGLELVYLSRPSSHGFDLRFGVGATIHKLAQNTNFPDVFPSVNLGYRFKLEKNYMRIGVGLPYMVNISFGF